MEAELESDLGGTTVHCNPSRTHRTIAELGLPGRAGMGLLDLPAVPECLVASELPAFLKVQCLQWMLAMLATVPSGKERGSPRGRSAAAPKGARLQGVSRRQILGRHWDAYFEPQPAAAQQFPDKAHPRNAGDAPGMGNAHWRSREGGAAAGTLAALAYVVSHLWACTNPRRSSARVQRSAHLFVLWYSAQCADRVREQTFFRPRLGSGLFVFFF